MKPITTYLEGILDTDFDSNFEYDSSFEIAKLLCDNFKVYGSPDLHCSPSKRALIRKAVSKIWIYPKTSREVLDYLAKHPKAGLFIINGGWINICMNFVDNKGESYGSALGNDFWNPRKFPIGPMIIDLYIKKHCLWIVPNPDSLLTNIRKRLQ